MNGRSERTNRADDSALIKLLMVCGALALSTAVAAAGQAFDLLPPIGPAPSDAQPLFEQVTLEFSPAVGSVFTESTEITDMVRTTRVPGSFNYLLLFVRDDGALRVWGRGGLGPSGGGSGGKMIPAQIREPYFAKGRRFDAVLLLQYSHDPTGFALRTRATPRCIYYNCFGGPGDVIMWERVHYRRLVPLNWRRE